MPFSFQRPKFSKLTRGLRAAYNFDGVDDRAQLAYRAINPDGDIDIRWKQREMNNSSGTPRCIVTQCVSSTVASREFQLRWQGNGGNLSCIVGGVEMSPTIPPSANGDYRLFITGTVVAVFKDGVQIGSRDVARGGAREPAAFTLVGARNSSGTFPEVMLGTLFDIEINGTLWPMSDKDYAIQLPVPSGLGVELITPTVLDNPASKGSQWTYLGAGRWQYVGDGTANILNFISNSSQPSAGFLEFEVESITGVMRCYTATSSVGVLQSDPIFSKVGKFRHYYTDRNGIAAGSGMSFTRQASGQFAECIIKNISFKPLGTCNPMTLVNTTSDRWQEV